MAHFVAKYRPDDMPFADEVFIGYDGQEFGFAVVDSEGEEYSDFPYMTPEEATQAIKEQFEGIYSSFEWLDNL